MSRFDGLARLPGRVPRRREVLLPVFVSLWRRILRLHPARVGQAGADAIKVFKRRLTGLLLIGLAHSTFIWFGDILATYAVLGFALIPFVRRDDRAVLRWAAIMLLAPIALYALLIGLAVSARRRRHRPTPGCRRSSRPRSTASRTAATPTSSAATSCSQSRTSLRRLLLMFFPRVLGMFLLGFYAGRAGIFANLDAHAALLRRVCAIGFAVGLPLSLLASALLDTRSAAAGSARSRRNRPAVAGDAGPRARLRRRPLPAVSPRAGPNARARRRWAAWR